MTMLRGSLLGGAAALLMASWMAPASVADVKVGDATIKNHGLVAAARALRLRARTVLERDVLLG